MEIAILALGCFWKPENKFNELNGVIETEVGYCGGNNNNTNYEEVCSGKTNHAEVVKINFDENIISYEKIIEFFFEIHDPTTLNSQGPDFGTQYRSEIFFNNGDQKKIAEKAKQNLNQKLNGKIVTNISKEKNYCKAEDYHQKYIIKKKIK
jgi:methionine-S-sulfoxide reductase